jgi:hypothetical protein
MKQLQVRIGMLFALLALCLVSLKAAAQESLKPTIAVTGIDCRSLRSLDSETVAYMVRLELEKTGAYTVMDRYEVNEIVAKNKLDLSGCYAKSCLVETGRILGVSKMLSGSVELLGAKLVITLRLIDVQTASIEKTVATEYLNLPELQKMIRISVQRIVGIEPDVTIVNQLIDYDVPIQSPKNAYHLNGPRIGFAYTMGEAGQIATGKETRGGFGMFPVGFEFGWQQEIQYISAGSFQALIENIFLIGGLESGKCIPSYTPLLGFRFGKNAWEFAFGPTFRAIQKADGFYDADGLIGPANEWHLQKDWAANKPSSAFPASYDIVSRLDSRGDLSVSTGLVIALGRTFHSGYLNIPVNMYVAPRKEGTSMGATFGFNIQKKDRNHRQDIYKKGNGK